MMFQNIVLCQLSRAKLNSQRQSINIVSFFCVFFKFQFQFTFIFSLSEFANFHSLMISSIRTINLKYLI
jgi:hypothetical protein